MGYKNFKINKGGKKMIDVKVEFKEDEWPKTPLPLLILFTRKEGP